MTSRPPGTFRVVLLLARLSLVRRKNRWLGAFRRRSRGPGRPAVARKSRGGGILLTLFAGLFLLQGVIMSSGFLERLSGEIEVRHGWAAGEHYPRPTWPTPEHEGELFAAVGLVLGTIFLAVLFLELGTGNQDLSRPGYTVEWLFGFPVESRGLFLAKVFEYALTDALAWMLTAPLLGVLFVRAGLGVAGVPLALTATLLFTLMMAAVRLLAETFLRLRLPLERLKDVQAGSLVIGLFLLLSIFVAAFSSGVPGTFLDVADAVGGAIFIFPPALPALLRAHAGAGAAFAGAAAAIVFLALTGCARLTRDGLVVSGGGPWQGKREQPVSGTAPPRLRGVLGKEVRLLLRDRSFLVQTLVMPISMIALQFIVNPSLGRAGSHATAVVAFGVGAYVHLYGAFGVLASERQSLWLLYTFPQRLEVLLRRKAVLWGSIACVYTLATLALSYRPEALTFRAAIAPVLAVAGTFAFAFLASGIAVLGTDALEEEPRKRLAPQWVYLYLLLGSIFGHGLAAPSPWSGFVNLILMALLANAIWQKAAERLPLLLDPVATPPRRVSLADGLIGALLFFLLQAVATLVWSLATGLPLGVVILLSYASAGLLTVLFMALGLRRVGWTELRQAVGLAGGALRGRPAVVGLAAGAAAGAVGLLWLRVVDAVGPLRNLREEMLRLSPDLGPGAYLSFAALAIIAAPVFEEILFRGLVFRGLRGTVGFGWAALASALVFAIVHPPLSFPAVLALGLATAWALERTGSLYAAVAAHAAYNALVLFLSSS